MSQFESNPPTFGDPDFPPASPGWPRVIGIISIVWASLGVICNGCTAIGPLVQPMIQGMMPANVQQQMQQQAQTQSVGLSVGLAVLGIAMSGLLMFAGIKTLKFQWQGRMLHLLWAIASFVLGVIGGVVGFQQMKQQMAAQMQQMQSDPNTAAQAQNMQPAMETMGYVTFGCMMLFVMAWPLFVLIWFGLIKTRPEQMGPPPQEIIA
jgi:hypothetical protein